MTYPPAWLVQPQLFYCCKNLLIYNVVIFSETLLHWWTHRKALNTVAHHNSVEPTLLLHRCIHIIIHVVSAFTMFKSNLVKFSRGTPSACVSVF